MQKRTLLIFLGVLVLLFAVLVFVLPRVLTQTSSEEKKQQVQPVENQQPQQEEELDHDVPPPVDPSVFEKDQDRDGILDEEEEALGLSSSSLDSDGDGLTDRAELRIWGTDPLNTDSDGDGFSDGYEVLKGYNPAGEGSLEQQ